MFFQKKSVGTMYNENSAGFIFTFKPVKTKKLGESLLTSYTISLMIQDKTILTDKKWYKSGLLWSLLLSSHSLTALVGN